MSITVHPVGSTCDDSGNRLQVDFVDLYTIAMIAQNTVSKAKSWILRSAAADNYYQRRATIQD